MLMPFYGPTYDTNDNTTAYPLKHCILEKKKKKQTRTGKKLKIGQFNRCSKKVPVEVFVFTKKDGNKKEARC